MPDLSSTSELFDQAGRAGTPEALALTRWRSLIRMLLRRSGQSTTRAIKLLTAINLSRRGLARG